MQNVSAEFLAAMENTPYIAKMTLDGTDIVQGTAILHFSAQGGANSSDEGITLGGTVSGSVTITLDKDQVSYALENRKMLLELGIELNSDIEWIAAGTYKITDVTEDDGNLIVKAADALSSEFDVEYEPIEGFDFDTEDGVDSLEFLAALCARRGVEIEMSDLTGIPMKASPEGYTERKIIGFISALHGGFADIDRYGVLKIRWYTETGITVDADRYYAGGMEKASFDFVVGWLRCYVEPNAETLILGDTAAAQGIYFECPWMTEERLEEIWTQIQGFSYRPVPALKFFGDPRLDPGDIITLEDLGGTVHAVPVMSIRYEYDGGIISSISAKGQAKTGFYEGPVTRETKRLYSQIIKRQNVIELTIKELDGDKIISLINLSDSEAYIKAPKIKLEGIVTANSNFRVLEDGSIKTTKADISGKVTATEGEIGGCKIVDGKLQVSAANITGTITASKVVVKNTSGATLLSAGDNAVVIAGWKADSNSLYSGDSFSSAECFICTGSSASMSIGGSDSISGWMIKAGSNFGVTKAGALYASDAYIKGKIEANSGTIGKWNINGNKMYAGDGAEILTAVVAAPRADNTYVFAAGGTSHSNYSDCPFRVSKTGKLYASDAEIAGKIDANSGSIGDWNVGDVEVVSASQTVYSGPALYSDDYYDAAYNTEVAVALTPERVYVWGRDSTGAAFEDDVSWGALIKAAKS